MQVQKQHVQLNAFPLTPNQCLEEALKWEALAEEAMRCLLFCEARTYIMEMQCWISHAAEIERDSNVAV